MTYVRTQMTEHDQPSNDVLRRIEALERAQGECTQNFRHVSKLEQLLQDAFVRIEEAEKIIKMLEHELLEKDATVQESQYFSQDQQSVVLPKSKIRKSEKRLNRLVELVPEGSDVNDTDIIRENKRGSLIHAAGSMTVTEVAFSVTMASQSNFVFQANQILTYETVLYNEGNAYNPKMGVFTCPVTGTYYFFANVGSSPAKSAAIGLKLDGLLKGHALALASLTAYEQGSTAVCVKCHMGQNVYVEAFGDAPVYGDYYTSFSGFLISREDAISS